MKTVLLLQEYGSGNEDNYEISPDDQTITITDNTYNGFYSPRDAKKTVYQWDPSEQSYLLAESYPSPQQQGIEAAEKALFEANDPVKAIQVVQPLLKGKIMDPVTSWAEGNYVSGPSRTRPYLMYLLGLAYERTGDEVNAVRAYWQLWHDFPDNPYSFAARRKLQPVIPSTP
jgi:hypothetical protein